jgi:ureidoacrylate peracid hydrolase
MTPPEQDSLPIRPHIRARVLARRGRLHLYDRLDPARTALAVIDMQETFCAEGAPAEVPLSRHLAGPINTLTAGLRARGVPVIWVLHANTQSGGHSDWETFFGQFVGGDMRARTVESLAPGRQSVWSELQRGNDDLTIVKNRYSALISGASILERVLRARGIDTLLIAGTKTDVCCESTARDAMMLDFRVVVLADCCAALSEEEHRDALETIIQQFGDVMDGADALRLLDG